MNPMTEPAPHALFVETSHEQPAGQPRQSTMEFLRDLEPGEFEQIQQACNFASEAVEGFILFVRRAVWDLNRSIEEVQADAGKGISAAASHRWNEDLQYRVLNVCTAVRMFEEHVTADVYRKFGEGSEQDVQAKKLFSHAYDGSFAYRLLYRLRNAIVHGSRSLMAMHVALYLDESVHPPRQRGELRMDLNRKAFNDKRKAPAPIRHEVMSSDVLPNLLRLSNELLPVMEDLTMRLTDVLQPGLPNMLLLLADLMNEAAAAGGAPLLANIGSEHMEAAVQNAQSSNPAQLTMNWSFVPIPQHVAELVIARCSVPSGNIA